MPDFTESCRFELRAKVGNERYFKQCFRANKSTFARLVRDLAGILQKQDTVMKNAITAEARVAIGLYHYGHDGDY